MDAQELAALEAMGGDEMSALNEPRLFRGLVYGDPGAGKTDLAIKLAGIVTKPNEKIILVSSDSAWVTILKYPELADRTKKVTFKGFSQLRAIANAKEEGLPYYSEVGTVIWDTVSRSVDRSLRVLTDRKKFPKEQRDPDLEAYPHYRLVEKALGTTVKVLNASTLNVIYTAHIREPSEKDRDNSKFAIRPNMPEASFKVVAEEVALIGWLHKEHQGGSRQIQLEGTKTVTAKSQISTIPEATYKVDSLPQMLAEWVG